jgi:hypothetical protein
MLSKFLLKALEGNTLKTLACKLPEKKTFGIDSAALKMIISCLVP